MSKAKVSIARQLLLPTLLLALLTLPFLYWDDLAYALGLDVLMSSLVVAQRLLGIVVWLLVAVVVIRIVDVALWQGVIERRLGWAVPKLLRDLVAALILLTAVAGIISVVFGKSLTVFVAFTGGAGFIIGLAAQKMIGDLFAGIVINLERPFKIGEEIVLDDTFWGTVVDVNWRSTTFIESPTAQRVRLPNSQVINQKIASWTMGGDPFLSVMFFHFDYDVPVDRAHRVLAAAATEAQQGVGERKAKLNIFDVDGRGYGIRLRCWLREATLPDDRRRLVKALQRHMEIAGIRPLPVEGLRFQYTAMKRELPSPMERKLNLLGAVDLLAALEPDELAWLADRMREREYPAGEPIIERGAIGESMFIVFEGVVDVYIATEDGGDETRVNRMGPGEFFGELSLLTGEPRTATIRPVETGAVLYEITKSDLRELLAKRPELADELAKVIAGHRIRSERKLKDLPSADQAVEAEGLRSRILGKLKSFFGI